MADISAWSPVDESNTASPPHGWPENMQNSGVNNSARAMMGGVRRWYDSVNTQFAAVDTKFGGYLPLTGGTLSGNLHAPYLHSTGNIDAGGQIAGATVVSSGAITGTTVTGSTVNSNGNMSAAGAISAASVSAGTITASGGMSAAGVTVGAGGLVVHANGQIDGTLNANALTAGSASVSTVTLGGALFAASSGDQTIIYDRSSNANISMYNSANINYYQSNTHQFTTRGSSTTGATYTIFNPGGTYNQTGSWGTISDDSMKTDVAPYRTDFLGAVCALNPVSFRYSSGPFKGDRRLYGLMASNVRQVVPEMVSTSTFVNEDGKELTVDTLLPTHLIYVLLGAAKELASRVEALENATGGQHV